MYCITYSMWRHLTFIFIQSIPQELCRDQRSLNENGFSLLDASFSEQTLALKKEQQTIAVTHCPTKTATFTSFKLTYSKTYTWLGSQSNVEQQKDKRFKNISSMIQITPFSLVQWDVWTEQSLQWQCLHAQLKSELHWMHIAQLSVVCAEMKLFCNIQVSVSLN